MHLYHGLILVLIFCLVYCSGCTRPSQAVFPRINRSTQAQVFIITTPQHTPIPTDISKQYTIVVVPTLPNPTKSEQRPLPSIDTLLVIFITVFTMFLLYRLTRRDQSVEAFKGDIKQEQKEIKELKNYVVANRETVLPSPHQMYFGYHDNSCKKRVLPHSTDDMKKGVAGVYK